MGEVLQPFPNQIRPGGFWETVVCRPLSQFRFADLGTNDLGGKSSLTLFLFKPKRKKSPRFKF
jgi:hypothetical protein